MDNSRDTRAKSIGLLHGCGKIVVVLLFIISAAKIVLPRIDDSLG
jgi:hypothetical protein